MNNEIQLTEVELLKIENANLKLAAVRSQLAGVMRACDELSTQIQARLQVEDLNKYEIDLKTGKGTLKKGDEDGSQEIAA